MTAQLVRDEDPVVSYVREGAKFLQVSRFQKVSRDERSGAHRMDHFFARALWRLVQEDHILNGVALLAFFSCSSRLDHRRFRR